MPKTYRKLTRPNIRKLNRGEKLTEQGICAERLSDGDIRYSVNVMVDGERIHRVIGRESEGVTRTQAEQFIETKRTEAREGRLGLPRNRKLHLTFSSASDLYLAKLQEIGGKDYVNNEQHIRLHLKPYFGKMHIDTISNFTLKKFRKHCLEKKLSVSTINRVLATYRRMARQLFVWKLIPTPMPMIKLEREYNQRDYVLSQSEEKTLLNSALNDSNSFIHLFIQIGLATGLRHSEILSARFDNFDPIRRRLRVLTKGGRWRNQPLTRGITEILKNEREMAEDANAWMFPSKTTKSGHIEAMIKPFQRCVVASDLDPQVVIPHAMRHTAITRYAATGADIKSVQEFGGHLSLSMVLRYAHPSDDAINRALDRMEGGTITELQSSLKDLKS